MTARNTESAGNNDAQPPYGIGFNSSKGRKGYYRDFRKNKKKDRGPITLTPEGAKKFYATRPKKAAWKPPLVQTSHLSAASGAPDVVPGPPSISELARALKYDVDLIYEWVTNNINFYPVWGHFKGAFGALVDQSGTSFDIADLMIQLLRESGYTANFVYGQIGLSGIDAANWLGVGLDNSGYFSGLVSFGAIPNQYGTNGDGSLSGVVMSHVWVRVTIDDVDYDFDPSFKQMQQTGGIDVGSAMEFDLSTFMSNADEGATITSDYIQNINRANILSDLETLSGNLLSYIQTNMPGAKIQDILGGQTMVPFYGVLRNARLPYELPNDEPEVWTSIPSEYEHTLEVQILDMDITFNASDISGRRLTLWWDDLNVPSLYVDGTSAGSGSAGSPGDGNLLQMTITHPYDYTYGIAIFIETGQDALIECAWGHTNRNNVERHRANLALNQFNGGSATDEGVLGSSLAVVGTTVDCTDSMMFDIYDGVYGTTTLIHSNLWLIQNDNTTMTNGFGGYSGSIATKDNSTSGNFGLASELLTHAMETCALEAAAGLPSVGAATVIDLETQISGGKVFDANSSNWSTNVRPNLIDWDSSDLDNIETNYIDEGWRIILPQDGALSKNEWTGYAWYPLNTGSGITAALGTSAKGGIATEDQTPEELNTQAVNNPEPMPPPEQTSEEPIDLYSGGYLYDHLDLSVGSSQFPYRLDFVRSYRSNNRLSNGPLGLGWTHNYNLTVTLGSDPFQALGSDEPVKAIDAIVALYVIANLFEDELTTPIDQFTATQCVARWFLDQLSNNTATINFAAGVKQFVMLGSGSYYSGADGCTFVQNEDGTYTYTTAQKAKYNFYSNGQLDNYVDPAGVTVQCTYTSGKLTSISNGLDRTLTLSYSGDFVSEVSDGNGRSVSYTVDGSNNLTAFENANEHSTTYSYDSSNPGLLTQFFSPANPADAIITNSYDSLFRVATQTDAYGNEWKYYFSGARSEEVDPLGNSHVLYYNRYGKVEIDIDALGNEWSYTYDGRKLLMQKTLPEGNANSYSYDLNGNLLEITYKPKPGSSLDAITNSFTYNSSWNKVATATDGNDNTTSYSYDSSSGRLLTLTRPEVGGETPQITYTYNTRGQVLTLTDETGIVSQFNYDTSTEKLLSKVVDYGTGAHLNLTTSYGYDAAGNVTSVTDPNSNETTFVFDDERQMTQRTEASPFSYVTNYSYDDNGNLTSIERQTGGSPAWQTYSMTYSIVNKQLTAADPLSNTTSYTYDAKNRLSTATDAQARTTTYFYDPDDRISAVRDSSGTIADSREYSPNGKLARRTDARGNATLYSYDGFDRLTTTTFADGSYSENQAYDDNGNLLVFRTRSGNTVTSTYDVLNRLSTKAPTGQGTVTFTYDLHGRLLRVSKPVVSGDPSTGDFTFSYDTAGRIYQESTPDSKTTTFELDGNGNITKLTYPDGYYITRLFDQLNRLTGIKLNGASSEALSFSYDELSRRTQLTYGNGAVATYGYQLNNDMTSLEHAFTGSASITFTYGFNSVHQETSRSVSDSAYMWEPTASETTVYGPANPVNEYPSVDGTDYTYDGNGNLSGNGTWTYTFDTENHLTAATETGTSVSYVYDGLHRQIQKTVGTTKSRYVYPRFRRIADYDGTSGELQNRYVYGPGLDESLVAVSNSGTLTFLHADRQASIIATTNSSATVTDTNAYSPYGEGTVSGTTFGFTGQRYDADTGLYYFKRRYYSAVIGRFLQSDPVARVATRYVYVSNDPINQMDPMGLQAKSTNPYMANYFGIIGSPKGDTGVARTIFGADDPLSAQSMPEQQQTSTTEDNGIRTYDWPSSTASPEPVDRVTAGLPTEDPYYDPRIFQPPVDVPDFTRMIDFPSPSISGPPDSSSGLQPPSSPLPSSGAPIADPQGFMDPGEFAKARGDIGETLRLIFTSPEGKL